MVELLDDLRDKLIAAKPKRLLGNKLLGGLLSGRKLHQLQRGLYVWGGVGRGKTWLMDLFFQSLPFRDKQRSHFHRFMQSVHDELKKHKGQSDPLDQVADRLARKARVLCFDELFVTDIADTALKGPAHFAALGSLYPLRQVALAAACVAVARVRNRRLHLGFAVVALAIEAWRGMREFSLDG